MNRAATRTAFLARAGHGGAACVPLAQDASLRRYWRIGPPPATLVLMDAPPPENVRPFLAVAAHLAALGLSVPRILAADAEAGLLLEEDFGDALFGTLLDAGDPQAPAMMYSAIAALARMQDAPLPGANPDWQPAPWDTPAMLSATLDPLFTWWWPAMFGAPPPEAARTEIAAALAETLAPLAALPAVLVHRDFFAGNLVWLPERTGAARAGILDFQSAAPGHPAYDLVSLLEDARRDLDPALTRDAHAAFLTARPGLDPTAFAAGYAACAAQRHLRVSCQWTRLALRDGKPHYLAHGPLSWARLDRALAHPVAAPLARALDRFVAASRRTNPPGLLA